LVFLQSLVFIPSFLPIAPLAALQICSW
jgi:hypothetical protein